MLGLAVVEGLERGQLVAVLLDEVGQLEQQVAAIAAVGFLPRLEGFGRGRDSIVDLCSRNPDQPSRGKSRPSWRGSDILAGRELHVRPLRGKCVVRAHVCLASLLDLADCLLSPGVDGGELGPTLGIDKLVVDEELSLMSAPREISRGIGPPLG